MKDNEFPVLMIDEKWSIWYDPNNNDLPVAIYRYGEYHSKWELGKTSNVQLALFYALLNIQNTK